MGDMGRADSSAKGPRSAESATADQTEDVSVMRRDPPLHTCVRNGQIVCVDDLCRGTSRTICGLEEGIDFGLDEADDYYDDWEDQ